MKYLLLAALAFVPTLGARAADQAHVSSPYRVAPRGHDEYCARASANFSQVSLENAGIIEKNSIDIPRTEVQLLAKKRLFKDIWELVYHLVLHQNDGKSLAVIVVTTSYYGECPGDAVKTYVVSKDVGELPSLKYLPDVEDRQSK
jgi:hypothetical protein